jgi:hypothetical protein
LKGAGAMDKEFFRIFLVDVSLTFGHVLPKGKGFACS